MTWFVSLVLYILYKTERLFPSQYVKDWISFLEDLTNKFRSDEEGRSPGASFEGDGGRRRSPSPHRSSERGERQGRSPSSHRSSETGKRRSPRQRRWSCGDTDTGYTRQQLRAVQRILWSTEPHKILGIRESADNSEIKSAYKKLSRLVHPDKNKAPDAEAAFKALYKAYEEMLSAEMPTQRESTPEPTNPPPEDTASRGNEEDSREDTDYQQRSSTFYTSKESFSLTKGIYISKKVTMFMLLPSIMLLLAFCFISEPTYKLSPNVKYNTLRHTKNMGVYYYVKENFLFQNIQKVEKEIEDKYVADLRRKCSDEKEEKKTRRYLKTPSCERLTELYVYGKIW